VKNGRTKRDQRFRAWIVGSIEAEGSIFPRGRDSIGPISVPQKEEFYAMAVKVHVIFYSMYGHVFTMAEAIAAGAREVPGAEVKLFQVPELVPEDVLVQRGAKTARAAFADVPIATVTDLADADALVFGTPTRFGNMCSQMRNFLDQTGGLWVTGALVGKVGSVFVSTATQHGGQETTITSFHNTLFHHGMIVVGAPPSEKAMARMDEITGGGPYGAATLAGSDGRRNPSENELQLARSQGRHVAEIAARLVEGARRRAGLDHITGASAHPA
jgi:NAD(P)H:quinone oxidoreductase type IV